MLPLSVQSPRLLPTTPPTYLSSSLFISSHDIRPASTTPLPVTVRHTTVTLAVVRSARHPAGAPTRRTRGDDPRTLDTNRMPRQGKGRPSTRPGHEQDFQKGGNGRWLRDPGPGMSGWDAQGVPAGHGIRTRARSGVGDTSQTVEPSHFAFSYKRTCGTSLARHAKCCRG